MECNIYKRDQYVSTNHTYKSLQVLIIATKSLSALWSHLRDIIPEKEILIMMLSV